ncbi:MAG: amino acid adenylation domain-containing protein [Bacteroidota bacterium]
MVDIIPFTGVKYKAHLDFWKQNFDASKGGFQFRQKMGGATSNASAYQTLDFELAAPIASRIFQLVNHNDLGVYVTLVTGLSILLHKYTKQAFVILDSPLHKPAENEQILASRVPLVIAIDETNTWKQQLVKNQEMVRNSYQYQHYPLQLVDQDRSQEPYASNILLTYHALHQPLEGDYDWVISFQKENNSLKAVVRFKENAFDKDFIERAWHHFETLLANLNQLDRAIQQSSLFSAEEKQQILVGFNATEQPWAQETMHALFEKQAAQTPDKVALVYHGIRFTYAQLNAAANALAHYLRETYQLTPDSLVGLMVNRSERMIIGILGVLKAGAAYLPIDPTYPADRKAYMLSDAGVNVLLTDSDLLFDISFFQGEIFALDIQLSGLPEIETNPLPLSKTEDLAYVIYTSGSTGKPKGVMIEHRGNVNMSSDQVRQFGITADDKVLQFASLSFDASVSEIFMAFYAGATLVLLDKSTIDNTALFEQYLQKHEVTVVTLPPVYLRALDKASLTGLRVIITAGEAAYVDDALACSQFCQYYNAYGPTETSVCVSLYAVSEKDADRSSIPIGKPIANMEAYVLDERGEMVPIGLAGELCVSGLGLARGYINSEEITNEKFVAHPIIPGKRMYKTGDFAKWTADGNLEFLGRRDDQLKLRGYRIEPGEVAAVINQHRGVQEAFVMKATSEDLMAVVVPHRENAAALYEVTKKKNGSEKALMHTLPNGMVVFHKNRFETEVLFEEIFQDRVYQQGGIRLPKGAVIVDVGANIGMFSLYAGLHLRGAATIYAFEPVEEIFDLLVANADLYKLQVKAFQEGLSNVEQEVTFTYYPNNTALSGRYGDAEHDKQMVRQAIQNRTVDGEHFSDESVDLLVEERVSSTQVTCLMRRLSDVIREEGIARIDLLKIDAEKSELEVLEGIEAEDWGKIKQIAIEVHDVAGEVASLEEMLREKGFEVVIIEEESLTGTGLFNVYATRTDQPLEDNSEALVFNTGEMWTNAEALIEDIKRSSREKMPDYMVPTLIKLVDHIPLTPNGKVDKQALLLLPGLFIEEKPNYTAARSELEQQLVELWQEILGKDGIGVFDDFFELGGQSLKATKLVSQLYKRSGVNLDLASLFSHPTVAALAELISQSAQGSYESIPTVEEQAYYELSHAQRRLWILNQFEESKSAYNIPGAYHFEGEVNLSALEAAFQTLIERHESLRTTFVMVEGEPKQKIHSATSYGFKLDYLDLQRQPDRDWQAQQLAKQEARRTFDLENGPMLRTQIIQLEPQSYVFLFMMHHIVSDGWSMEVLIREVSQLYMAYMQGEPNPLPPLRIQYKDYAAWQHQQLSGEKLARHQAYWWGQFKALASPLELPTDYPRPFIKTYNGNIYNDVIETSLLNGLQKIAQQNGATLFMVLESLVKVLLYRYTGQSDITVGTPIAGRDHADLENQIGFYINTLALRSQFSGQDSFTALLQAVKANTLEAYQYQAYPFDRLVNELELPRDLSRSPLFDVVLVLQNIEEEHQQEVDKISEVSVGTLQLQSLISQVDLRMGFKEMPSGLLVGVEYNTDMFKQEWAIRFWQHFKALVASVVADPASSLDQLAYISEAEQQTLLRFNATQREFPSATMQELFEAQVARTPDQVAVIYQGTKLTYAQLNAEANRLAHYLREQYHVQPDTLVGLMVHRSERMIIALLGILKAGSAYLPIDPSYPADRKAFMLSDAGIQLLLTDSELLFEVGEYAGELLALDVQLADLTTPATNPVVVNQVSDLAYVIYTSGSTGQPKGVMMEHRGNVNMATDQIRRFGITSQDKVLQFASLSFDASVSEACMALYAGAGLVLVDKATIQNQALMLDFLRANQVTVATFPPSYLTVFPLEELAFLRVIITAGEAAIVANLTYLSQFSQCFNAYGPTEASVCVTIYEVQPTDATKVIIPIGTPIANTEVYLLDEQGGLVPMGLPGELCVSGVGLARGYLKRPELTEEKFVNHPFQAGARLYKTGDLARWTTEGQLEYMGRKDEQLKLRGYRIEPGEVAAVLSQHAGVQEAFVMKGASGELMAIVVPQKKESTSEEVFGETVGEAFGETLIRSLQQWSTQQLPEFMVPTVFKLVESLPFTPNGKVDKKALLQLPGLFAEAKPNFTAARNALEQQLVELWQEVLDKESIGIYDNFFELGGHSLKATKLVSQLYKHTGVNVDLASLFNHPTVASFAELIARSEKGNFEAIPRVIEQAYYELSHAQRRLWVANQFEESRIAYNIPGVYVFEGEVNLMALEAAFKTLIERHESLRTTFVVVDGEPKQKIHPAHSYDFRIEYHDLRELPDGNARAMQQARKEARRAFDLENGPLLRTQILHVEPQKYVFLFMMHHIVSDGSSMQVLIREVTQLYIAYCQGEPHSLPALNLQYKDYAAWQIGQLSGENLERHQAYWWGQFQEVPPVLQMSTDYGRPLVKTYNGEAYSQLLDKSLLNGLQALAQQNGATLFMVLESLVKTLLYRYTGQTDITIGTPIAGRSHPDLENQIGFYINTLALRSRFSGQDSFTSLLQAVKDNTLQAYQFQAYPFDRLVDELDLPRDLSRSPLFDVAVVLQNIEEEHHEVVGQIAEVSIGDIHIETGISQVDFLRVGFSEQAQGFMVGVEYNTDIFKQAWAVRFLQHFKELVTSVLAHPASSLDQLAYMSEAEQQTLLRFNATQREFPSATMQELFEAQVMRTPDQIAVIYQGTKLTYAQLNAEANRLAHYLREHYQVQPDTLVGLMVHRSERMIIALLGILKAGGAYVPIDPSYPADRKAFMLSNAGIQLLLTDSELLFEVGEYAGELLALDVQLADLTMPSSNPVVVNQVSDLAYVIYTSGSTGQPKGVLIEHQGNVNMATDQIRRFDITSQDKVLQFASLSFDASVYEITLALYAGASLVLLDKQLLGNTHEFEKYLQAQQVTVATLPPAYLSALDKDALHGLRVIITAGEAANVADALACSAFCRYYNAYGPTEASVCVSTYLVGEQDLGSTTIPIGSPIDNTQLYIVDTQLSLVSIGIIGEICIAGIGLARGYLNNAELTSEKFVDNPSRPGERLYKTGDLGKWLPSGDLEIIGRKDDQMKVRGFRVEPGEIVSVLRQYAGIQDAHILLSGSTAADKSIVAFLALADKGVLDQLLNAENATKADAFIKEVANFCQQKLPAYMVPSEFRLIEKIPLTVQGKVDKAALEAMGHTHLLRKAKYVAPADELEQSLVDIWVQVLNIPEIGVLDDFFELGGHSLKATKVISLVYKALGIKLGLQDLFNHPTIVGLKEAIQQTAKQSLVVKLSQNSPELPNLFFIPPATGSSTIFRAFAQHLNQDFNSYGLQYKGFDYDTPFDHSFEEMAQRFAEEIRAVQPLGSYLILGYSVGALLAFEVARILEQGGSQAQVIMLDKDTVPEKTANIFEHNPALAKQVLRHQVGDAWLAHAHQSDVERAERLLYHIAKLHANYQLSGKIQGNIIALEAVGNASKADMQRWKEYTQGTFTHVYVNGSHNDLLTLHVADLIDTFQTKVKPEILHSYAIRLES